jgi:4-hydroxy-4-methyl-2-oxoglutarate aldolase
MQYKSDIEGAALKRLQALTTPHLADACLRAATTVRCAPFAMKGVTPSMRCQGSVRPVRHAGSVDVFLEALEGASVGDVLVVDNEGLVDEACVGDLIALETKHAGLSGIVIWGLHRDTPELCDIGLPLFSVGSLPAGPLRVRARHPDALTSAQIGAWCVSGEDVVVGDADGVLFLPKQGLREVIEIAEQIRDTERRQAELMTKGLSLREQTHFDEYLKRSKENPGYGFREHLRSVSGAIET